MKRPRRSDGRAGRDHQRRADPQLHGPAILIYGFRPFFPFGALVAIAVALWLPMLSGRLVLPSAFSPIEWHVHELVYGYVPAVIAGFLLTAVATGPAACRSSARRCSCRS